jgi:uncharacterized protein YndB with AHSA1/START domain
MMITLRDSIEINARPEQVYKWLTSLDEHYGEWHPDHARCVYETGSIEEGGTFCFEEYIHGDLHKIKGRITRLDENRVVEYRCLFPASIICPKGSFIIEESGDHSVFTATLSFRFAWLFSTLAKDRVEAIKTHMREESENLKNLLES